MSQVEDNSETGIFERLETKQEQKIDSEHFQSPAEECSLTEIVDGPSNDAVGAAHASSEDRQEENSINLDDKEVEPA